MGECRAKVKSQNSTISSEVNKSRVRLRDSSDWRCGGWRSLFDDRVFGWVKSWRMGFLRCVYGRHQTEQRSKRERTGARYRATDWV